MAPIGKYLTFEDSGYVFGIDVDYVIRIDRIDTIEALSSLKAAANPFFNFNGQMAYVLTVQLGQKTARLPSSRVVDVVEARWLHELPVFSRSGALRASKAFIEKSMVVFVTDIEALINAGGSRKPPGIALNQTAESESFDFSKIGMTNRRWLIDALTIAHGRKVTGTLSFCGGGEQDFVICIDRGRVVSANHREFRGVDAIVALQAQSPAGLQWLPDMAVAETNVAEPLTSLLSQLQESLCI